jgi:hypothetical protein
MIGSSMEDRAGRIRALFLEALELEPERRAAFLEEACGGDDGLQAEVEELLASDQAVQAMRWGEERVVRLERSGAPEPATGQVIGGFEIIGVIGGGGMGTVYRARQASLGRDVALKVLRPLMAQDGRLLERFEREARAAARVSHPGVVQVLQAGVDAGWPFLALQLVEGKSLQEMLAAGGRVDVERALTITRDVARALEAVHAAGIVHRDIKPGNVLVEGDAPAARKHGRVFLTDFGLAALEEMAALTKPGDLLGTPAYMAPEQARGGRADRLSDVYSLGATLYALIAGRAPHEGSSHAELLARVAHDDPIPLRRLLPSLDADAVQICEKAMRWDSGDRYPSAAELAEDIDRRLEGRPVRARPATRRYKVRLWMRRNPWFTKAACLVLGLLLAGAAFFAVERWERRSAMLASVERLVGLEHFDEAKGMLEGLPWLPGVAVDDREVNLRIQVHRGLLQLGRAVRETKRLSSARRPAAWRALEEQIEQELQASRIFLGGMKRSALRNLWSVAAALEEMLESPEVDGSPAVRWCEERIAHALGLSLEGLLSLGLNRFAFRLAGETDPHVEGRQGSLASTLMAVRKILGEALGLVEEPQFPRFPRIAEMGDLLLDAFGGDEGTQGDPAEERRLGGFLAGLDRAMPILSPDDVYHALLLERLKRRSVLPVARRVEASAMADLDGDGFPEIVLGVPPRELKVIQWSEDTRKLGSRSFDAYIPGETQAVTWIDAVALEDVDGRDDGRREILVHCRLAAPDGSEEPRYLVAYKLAVEGIEPHGTPMRLDSVIQPGCLLVQDLDGDGEIEILAGTSSGGMHQRRVLVLREPFSGSPRITVLPDGKKPSDVLSVFTLDTDGDGRLEVGCTTARWQGLDLRLWRYDRGAKTFVGPLRFGPLGCLDAALVLDLDGRAPSELFFGNSRRWSYKDIFREAGCDALEDGACVVQFPAPFKVEPGERKCEWPLVWHDPLPRVSSDDPEPPETFFELSAAEWEGARLAVVASRSAPALSASSLELYLQNPGEPRHSFRRYPLFRNLSAARLTPYLVSLPGKKAPDLLLIRRGVPGDHPAIIEAWSFADLQPLEVHLALLRVTAYARLGHYDAVVRLAREELAHLEVQEGALGTAQIRLALAGAEAAGRVFDWTAMAECAGAARRGLEDLEEVPAKTALKSALREREELLARAKKVTESAPLFTGGGPFPVHLAPGGGREAAAKNQFLHRQEPILIEAPSDFELRFELKVEKLGWNRNVGVGLLPLNAEWRQERIGVLIAHAGGAGHALRGMHPVRRDGQCGPAQPLEEGKAYRVRLLGGPGGRFRFHQLELDAAAGAGARVMACPRYDLKKPLDEAGHFPRSAAMEPLLPGGYDIVIVDENPGEATETRLIVSNVEVRAAAAGD